MITRDITRPIIGPIVYRSGYGVGSKYDPIMQWNPLAYLNASDGALVEGGAPAGYLDKDALILDSGNFGNNFSQLTETFRPTHLPWEGRNYLHLSGISGNYVSTSPVDPSGDVFRIEVEMLTPFSSAPGTSYTFLSSWLASANERSWIFGINSVGSLTFQASPDGVSAGTADASLGVVPVDAVHFAAEVDILNSLITFETSVDGVTWNPLGVDVALSASPAAAAANTLVGAVNGGASLLLVGGVLGVRCLNDGVEDLNLYFDRDASDNDTSGTCGSGQPWTLNQSGDNPCVIVGSSFIRGDGADDRMSTGDVMPPMQTQCSIAARCRLLRTGAGTETIMELDSSNNRFLLRVSPAGTPFCYLSNGSFNANIYATSNLTLRQWHTLIAVWDNANISYYIDGVAAGSSVAGFSVIPTAGNTESSLWAERGGANIGCLDISKALCFPTQALTPPEITELHNALIS